MKRRRFFSLGAGMVAFPVTLLVAAPAGPQIKDLVIKPLACLSNCEVTIGGAIKVEPGGVCTHNIVEIRGNDAG